MNTEGARSVSYILFELAGSTYGVKSVDVQQLEMVEKITPVPNADSTVEGVVFSRGQVIPAISLRARFGFEKIPFDLRTRLLVVRVGERNIGFIVDSAREFKNISDESIVPPPVALAATTGRYLDAIANLGENTILLLDLEEVVRPNKSVLSAEEGNEL
ncbi:MAG TPA: chemotaxis protein CheW [Pyrinomonadaceae bacterium]|nr:chemotaxis protein CheW [Pyrinomonadaceae bacterium]